MENIKTNQENLQLTPIKTTNSKKLINNLDQSLKKLAEKRTNFIKLNKNKEISYSNSIKINNLKKKTKKNIKDKFKFNWLKLFKKYKNKDLDSKLSKNYKTNFKEKIKSELNSFKQSKSKINFKNDLFSKNLLKNKIIPKFNCLKKNSKKGNSMLKKYSSTLNKISSNINKINNKDNKDNKKNKNNKKTNKFIKYLKKMYDDSKKNEINENKNNVDQKKYNNIKITKSMIKNLNVFTHKNNIKYDLLNVKKELKKRKLNKSQRQNLYKKISKNLIFEEKSVNLIKNIN